VSTSPQLLDASKPPDDPYLPPQQTSQYAGIGLQQQHFYNQQLRLHYPLGTFDTSSIDGTINAVVRGEASVMQQHFGPPIPCVTSANGAPTSTFQQQFQTRQSPVKISENMDLGYAPGQSNKQSQQLNSSHFASDSSIICQQLPTSSQTFSHGLDELAELAQASSNLLEQSMTTRSGEIEDIYQQDNSSTPLPKHQKLAQFHQAYAPDHQSQQTLHFKVVQTSHRDELSSFPQHQNYMQQVFTVQQRQRPGTLFNIFIYYYILPKRLDHFVKLNVRHNNGR
jgi:hypothetical protein